MNIQFARPWLLYLVWLVPAAGLAWFAIYRHGERKFSFFFSDALLRKLSPPAQAARFYWQLVLLLASFLFMLVSAAGPQWGVIEETIFQRGRDLVIALDVSRSMLATDVRPSRLERAKIDILDLLRELKGDRAALVAFRGKAVQLCPLTIDYAFLEHAVDGVTIDSAPPGPTDIGDGLSKAIDAFESDEGAHRAIILVSDGEDLSERVKLAVSRARSGNIPVFTVGLGSPDGSTILDPSGKPILYQGKDVVTRLENETLKEIAEATGGAYVPVGTANVKLGPLYRDHLARLAAQDIEEQTKEYYADRYQTFLLPAVLLLLIAAFLSRGRPVLQRRSKPPLKQLSVFIVIAALASGSLRADTAATQPSEASQQTELPAKPVPTGRDGARAAQRLFDKGSYEEAAQAFMQASKDCSLRLKNALLFNSACALFEAGKYEAAARQFEALSKLDDPRAADSSYNLGCSLFRLADAKPDPDSPEYTPDKLEKLEKAGMAFQDAIRIDPDKERTRLALAAVTNALPTAREQLKINELMAKYGNWQPFQIAGEILSNQRSINEALSKVETNSSPSKIDILESLAARQRRNADLLIPLKPALAAALTAGSQPKSQQQTAALVGQVEALRDAMREASALLRDLDGGAPQASASEAAVYGLWKGMAPHAPLLKEDIRRQALAISATTNLLQKPALDLKQTALAQQNEAVDLTELFSFRFSESCATPHQAQPDEPASLSGDEEQTQEETQKTILELAEAAKAAQQNAAHLIKEEKYQDSLAAQENSLELLKEIEKLLPQDEQQESEQDKDQQKEKSQDQQEQGQQQEQQDQQDQQQDNQEQQGEKQGEQEPESTEQAQVDEKEMSEERAESLIERALQREKEYKREKMRSLTPPSSLDRDW